jgi:3-hydroxyacyl-[acyl-carrier-protein] dehydratase
MSDIKKNLSFDSVGILKSQQNRYPLLFIDKILDVVPYKSVTGIKNFTYNEWFFPAHYDDDPNVPGFIQIECLVQTFIMTFLCLDENQGNKTNFFDLDNAKFRKKIIPGDTLIIKAKLDSFKRGIAKGSAEGYIDNELACSAEFIVTMPAIFDKYIPKKQ